MQIPENVIFNKNKNNEVSTNEIGLGGVVYGY